MLVVAVLVGALVWTLPAVDAGDRPAAEAEGQLGLGVDAGTEPLTDPAAAQRGRGPTLPEALGAYGVAYAALGLYAAALLPLLRRPDGGNGDEGGRI